MQMTIMLVGETFSQETTEFFNSGLLIDAISKDLLQYLRDSDPR